MRLSCWFVRTLCFACRILFSSLLVLCCIYTPTLYDRGTHRCLWAAWVCIITRCLASMHFLLKSSRFREVKMTIRSKYLGFEHNGLRDKSSSRNWGKARTNSITESTSSTWFFANSNTFNWLKSWSGSTSVIWQLEALRKCKRDWRVNVQMTEGSRVLLPQCSWDSKDQNSNAG